MLAFPASLHRSSLHHSVHSIAHHSIIHHSTAHHSTTYHSITHHSSLIPPPLCSLVTPVKEQVSFGGFYHYQLISRFLSPALHGKLCWSEAGQVLVSVASDGIIYGWDVDKSSPIFQVSRHSDLITDLIAVNRIGMFITCSMDKRIVMWSAVNRRVQVRCITHPLDTNTTPTLPITYPINTHYHDTLSPPPHPASSCGRPSTNACRPCGRCTTEE